MSAKAELEAAIEKIHQDKKREAERHAALSRINDRDKARASALYNSLCGDREYLTSTGVSIFHDNLKVWLSYQGKEVFAVISGDGYLVGRIQTVGYQRSRITSDERSARDITEAIKLMMAQLAKLIEQ